MIFVILGPTASGKTDLANILANNFPNLVLVNSDAFQIYKDMDIGTAKISKDDPLRNRYHLLDIVDPSETYSVFEYQKACREIIEKSIKENKDVVLIGGTGLYVRAALYDYKFQETKEVDMTDLENLSDIELHNYLKEIDIEEANKIPYQNRKRVLRAIYLFRSLGKKKSEMVNEQKHEPIYKDTYFYLINYDRETLYKRINERTKKIVENGLVEEAKDISKKYNLSLTSKKAIGYEEAYEFIEGKINKEEMIEKISLRTRQYAKRQMTFFTHQFNTEKYYNNEEIIEDISRRIKNNG